MRDPVIVSAARTAVGKAKRGSLVHVRPDDMGAVVIKEAIKRAGIDPKLVEECVMGCAMPEAEQGMNVARQAIHVADLPEEIPAITVNRYCCSGLQSIWYATMEIMSGSIDVAVAGGTETMSMIPMGGNKIVPNIKMAEKYPQAYVGMGETAENVAKKYNINREDQDKIAVDSNDRAAEANEKGYFKEQIVPLPAYKYDGKGKRIDFTFDVDEGPRAGTTMDILGKLKPAFWKNGSVTAGNASQMSDGAGAVVLMDRDKAKELGVKPWAKLLGYSVVGFDPRLMGIGPALAIPRVIEKFGKPLGISLKDIDCFELNEAFASQALMCVRELGLEKAWAERKINPNGNAIALGHPLGATGAILTTKLLYHMRDHKLRYGIVSMCIGGGMGAAGLFENYLL